MVASQALLQQRVSNFNAETNVKSNDRTLILEPIPGKNTLSTSGLIDNRLFKGDAEHNLHAVRDGQVSLWELKYQAGILPEPLKQRWTSFDKLINFVKTYMEKRGLRIKEIKD